MGILNLAHYINLFSGCVVNILNYENINIPSSISVPFCTTRFKVVPLCNFMSSDPHRFAFFGYQIIQLDPNSNSTFPTCLQSFKPNYEIPLRKNLGQPRSWKCLTRFYIFPPAKPGVGVMPSDLYEEYFPSERRYRRTGYHILVQHYGRDLRTWSTEMRTPLGGNSALKMLLILVENNLVEKFQFCCKYCHDCFQVCYDINNDTVKDMGIHEVAHSFNRISDKSPWCILGSRKAIKYNNIDIRFSEISKNDVTIDGILLNLLLGGNASLQFHRWACSAFVQPTPRTPPGNVTLLQNLCSFNRPNIHPTIDIKADLNIEIVTGSRPYGFLTCSKPRSAQTSLETLVHVFPLTLWICILLTSIFLGLFALLTTKSNVSRFDIVTTGYIFLEQASLIAGNGKGETHMYFVCGPWILMSVILTNLIRGDNVQNTISPIRIISGL
ncbi:hypothetical protein Fcan01_20350 [Folsomia candida]|uniref:Uncharacterized protein n=1 Tax=Folsomia candida TaxID=158441 RepID=A0A226DKZ2_FOLCA|nr:hypothetical protein Fcan01_20350 [Folsomia candida]